MVSSNVSMELARQVEQLKLLHNIGLEIASVSDLDSLLPIVTSQTRNILGYDNCAIFLVEDEELVLKTASYQPKGISGIHIRIGQGIVGRCAESKKIINIRDITACDFYYHSGLDDVKSEIAAPIIFNTQLLGVITIESTQEEAFSKEDEMVLSILSAQLGVALRNAAMLDELKKIAITDGLTGLYNYRYFRERLDEEILRARRYERELSLILMDLDNFKRVNDLFGHLKGDEVLISVSNLIKKNVRRIDKASIMKDEQLDITVRYGGEEFMIILPETPLQGAIVVAERLKKTIKEASNQLIPQPKQLIITGSFGAVSLKHNESSEELIKRVDEAMYAAKAKGKDQVYAME